MIQGILFTCHRVDIQNKIIFLYNFSSHAKVLQVILWLTSLLSTIINVWISICLLVHICVYRILIEKCHSRHLVNISSWSLWQLINAVYFITVFFVRNQFTKLFLVICFNLLNRQTMIHEIFFFYQQWPYH